MRIVERFLLTILVFVMLLFNRSLPAESAQHDEMRNFSLLVAENRFVDNGDGTVTDTERHLMWQKGDNGEEINIRGGIGVLRDLASGMGTRIGVCRWLRNRIPQWRMH